MEVSPIVWRHRHPSAAAEIWHTIYIEGVLHGGPDRVVTISEDLVDTDRRGSMTRRR
jgi:hypothetical protein